MCAFTRQCLDIAVMAWTCVCALSFADIFSVMSAPFPYYINDMPVRMFYMHITFCNKDDSRA